jgi:segregation and condensation protein B
MDSKQPKNIIEAALLAAGRALTVDQIAKLFEPDADAAPGRDEIRAALEQLGGECAGRGLELVRVGSGYRYQVRPSLAPWICRLWEEKPPRYSRALLETLALIVYRQPITRAEIEEIRGVSVSSHIIKTLLEREWVRVLGHKDVPGKPALYGSTCRFLDDFNLRSLNELPSLAELTDLDQITPQLDLEEGQGVGERPESSETGVVPVEGAGYTPGDGVVTTLPVSESQH